jgi:hypothetical protein
MMLYSYRGNTPEPIPFSIVLSSGFTRTDPLTFTMEEIIDAGYIGPIEKPECDSQVETIDWDGSNYFIRPYNDEEIKEQWEKVLEHRTQLLQQSDWIMIKDYNFGVKNIDEWAIYRKSLRDLPSEGINPFNVSWPIPPPCELFQEG